MLMRSHWSAIYTGPHNGVFIKKLERLAGIKALELERERFLWTNNERVEGASFFVEHSAPAWGELVLEILHIAHLIRPTWSITIGTKSLSGSTNIRDGNIVDYGHRIADQVEITWEIAESQQYRRANWLGSQFPG